MVRLVIMGNSGSGKTTLADTHAARGLAVLDLDTIAWSEPGVRSPIERSVDKLNAFMDTHEEWVIERVLPRCTRLIFLDPGVEACLRHNAARPWGAHKYPSAEAQDERPGAHSRIDRQVVHPGVSAQD